MPRRATSSLPAAVFRSILPGSVGSKRAARKVRKSATKTGRSTSGAATRAGKAASARSSAAPSNSRASNARRRRRATPAPPTRSTTTGLPKLWKPRREAAKPPDPASLGRGKWHQFRYTGIAGTRAYQVYIPKGLRRTTRAPMLVALHGCTQNALDFAAGTRFSQLADTHRFIVVYPEQGATHNAQRCWNWFRSGHQLRGAGEPAVLAGIIRRVVQETARWRVDTTRIYLTGISAGGGMSLVLAATYPEMFAAVGVHSAPPYRSATGPADALAAMQGGGQAPPPQSALPPMIIFQGTEDSTVRESNGERIAGQWLGARVAAAEAGTLPAVGKGRQTRKSPPRKSSARGPRPYRITRWSARGRVQLELWVVEGLGHAWSGGSAKGSYSDVRGPRASTQMWRFFARHTTDGTGLPAR